MAGVVPEGVASRFHSRSSSFGVTTHHRQRVGAKVARRVRVNGERRVLRQPLEAVLHAAGNEIVLREKLEPACRVTIAGKAIEVNRHSGRRRIGSEIGRDPRRLADGAESRNDEVHAADATSDVVALLDNGVDIEEQSTESVTARLGVQRQRPPRRGRAAALAPGPPCPT